MTDPIQEFTERVAKKYSELTYGCVISASVLAGVIASELRSGPIQEFAERVADRWTDRDMANWDRLVSLIASELRAGGWRKANSPIPSGDVAIELARELARTSNKTPDADIGFISNT